jgi:hypothetical protein
LVSETTWSASVSNLAENSRPTERQAPTPSGSERHLSLEVLDSQNVKSTEVGGIRGFDEQATMMRLGRFLWAKKGLRVKSLSLTTPAEEVEQIETVEDAIRYVNEHLGDAA